MSLENLSKRKNSPKLCGKTVRCHYSVKKSRKIVYLKGGLFTYLECNWLDRCFYIIKVCELSAYCGASIYL